MKHTIRLAAVTLALMLSVSTVSCGSKSSSAEESYSGYMTANEAGGWDDYAGDAEYVENAAAVKDAAYDGATEAISGNQEFEDKIIRTADLQMESEDAQACYDTLAAFAKQNGGSEMNFSKERHTYEKHSYLTITAELKINPDKLDDFIALAEQTDKVTYSSIHADDVTEEYYDIKLRLDSKKQTLENYRELLKQAKSLQDSLEIQRYISDLTAEIESLEGRLRYYDAKVDLSTVNLTITQRDKMSEEIADDFQWDSLSFKDVGTLMKNGFLGVLNFLWSLLLWIIIIAAALSPIAVIAGVVFFFVRRYRKKHPKPQTANAAATAALPAQNTQEKQ